MRLGLMAYNQTIMATPDAFSITPYHGLLALIGLASFGLSRAIVATQHLHGRWSFDKADGVQKSHRLPTPRVGGLAIALALILAWVLLEFSPWDWLQAPATGSLADLLGPVLLAASPAFAAGLAEDLTKAVGVAQRLWASLVSGLLLCLLTGVSIQRVDVWGIDALLAWGTVGLFLSYAFSAFAAAGLTHAINIIDGINGLAASAVSVMLAAFAWVARHQGDVLLAWIAVSGAVAAAGFFLVNYPKGPIFMGDGGAYLLGFLLAAVAILLPARNPAISPWTSIVVCAYPVIEVLFSIMRRRHRARHPGQPDLLHLHSLIYRRVMRNHARTTALVGALVGAPALAGICLAHHSIALYAVFGLSALSYGLIYGRLVGFRWRAFKR